MKRRILLYEDRDAMRYAKRDSKELFKVMEDLLTIAEAYVSIDVVDDYVSFFNDPLGFMMEKYLEVWDGNLLEESKLRIDEVKGLKDKYDRLSSSLNEWNSAPIITATTMRTNIRPKNFKMYCKPEMEEKYRVLLNFIQSTREFEESFPTQGRRSISTFTDSLLDKSLTPKYEIFAEFVERA